MEPDEKFFMWSHSPGGTNSPWNGQCECAGVLAVGYLHIETARRGHYKLHVVTVCMGSAFGVGRHIVDVEHSFYRKRERAVILHLSKHSAV